MNNYEQCLTDENELGFFSNFITFIFFFGVSSVIAASFIANYVWNPMIMSEEKVRELELELSEEKKEVPYEERYPLSYDSDFADYENLSSDSESSSSEDSESSSLNEDSESSSSEDNEDNKEDYEKEPGEVKTSDEEMIFQLDKSEDSDEMSSGELVEKPDEETEQDYQTEKDVTTESVNKLTEKLIKDVIETSTINAEKQKRKKLKKLKRELEERIERIHLMKIIENTPLGNVLMYYDKNNKTFCYQGPKNIPFKYLETVARKYVQIFNCHPLYIDTSRELEKAEELLKKQREQEKMKQEDVNQKDNNDDVFANLKNYKKQNLNISEDINHKSEIQNIKRLVDDKKNIPLVESLNDKQNQNKNKNKNLLAPARSNRFTYKGKLDSSLFFKIKKSNIKIDFSTFKKMSM